MEYHGIPFEGTVWQASARYNNAVMSRADVDAFFEKARLGAAQYPESVPDDEPDTLPAPTPATKTNATVYTPHEHPLPSGNQIGSPSRGERGLVTAHSEQSTIQRAQRGSNQADLFVFGVTSSRQQRQQNRQAEFTFSSNRASVRANIFCELCKFIIANARALRFQPSEVGHDATSIHIEGGGSGNRSHKSRCSEVFAGYKTFAELYKSASDGCHLCSLLTAPDAEGSLDAPPNSASQVFIGVYGDKSFDGPGRIEIQDVHERYGRKVINLYFDSPSAKIQGSLQYKNTNTDELFELAKGWLEHCRKHHDQCRRESTSAFMPTRVLKVSCANGELSSVQLCPTAELNFPRAPYLALSHCWGTQNIIQLVSGTLAPFQRDVPITKLSQNFRDAALITAHLGYQYLWIDSLCIIQDSPEDKAREIPKMAEIYGNAILTIAALGAKDSSGGCFVTRNPLALVPALLRDGDADVRDQVWAWNHALPGPDADGLIRPPLHRRGWVVQERALARRTLHFGSAMVYWECLEASASEAQPEMQERAFSTDTSDPVFAHQVGIKTALQALRRSAESGGAWEQWEGLWWKLVKEYTASHLTRVNDKWNAISALAMEAEQCTKMRLYHGLWECNLFDEILWQCLEPGKRNAFAPSWSWLSYEGQIQAKRFNYDGGFRRLATVNKPGSFRVAADGLGRSRELLIRGYVFQVYSEQIQSSDNGVQRYALHLCEDNSGAELVWRWSPDVNPKGEWDLAALPLVKSCAGDGEIWGMVVRPTDASKLSWARVGIFRLYWLNQEADELLFGEGEKQDIVLV
ncbi:hypothetical protein JX266_009193 [Neoarthrinium moseri]|nr:hypothetical protein JX266_009193 [Neoarthrinium moseri]